MSKENVELVRRKYAAVVKGLNSGGVERGAFDTFIEWLHPEIDWRGPREFQRR